MVLRALAYWPIVIVAHCVCSNFPVYFYCSARVEEANCLFGGGHSGNNQESGMMWPRWNQTDYLHRAAVFLASAETVEDINFNTDTS